MRPDLRILVVDDEKDSRDSIVAHLRALGAKNVSATHDGAPALELLLATSGYDLVISDQNMPLMTGLQLLESLEARGRPEGFRFILVAEEHEKPHELPSSVDGFVLKPIHPRTFASIIEQVCHS